MHWTTEAARGDDFRTPSDQSENSLFPVWAHAAGTPGVKAITQLLFHANTQIKGKLSMIVDPGAWISIFGKTIARAITKTCCNAGYKPLQIKLSRTIGIAGVGNGANEIRHNYEGPIAIPTEEGHQGCTTLALASSRNQAKNFQVYLEWAS
jgi:hypothetical protein